MTTNPAEPCAVHTPAPVAGDRVVVIDGCASDDPDYRDETGRVLQVFSDGFAEVELDHRGWSAVFPSDALEVTP